MTINRYAYQNTDGTVSGLLVDGLTVKAISWVDYTEDAPVERIRFMQRGTMRGATESDILAMLSAEPELAIPLGLVPCPDCDGRPGEREKMTGPPGAGDIIIIACETCGGQNFRDHERRGCGWVNRECAAPGCTLTNGTPDDYCDVCQRAERGDT